MPKGSILGSLLFLIYIKDLSAVSPTTLPIMYADDTNSLYKAKICNEMEHDLNIEIQELSL